jgi:hypothetical protein
LFRGMAGPPFDLIPIMDVVNIADANERLRPEWKALLAEFPDRFVIGTDSPPVDFFYRIAIDVWRHILEDLPPDIATKLAYGNAEFVNGARSHELNQRIFRRYLSPAAIADPRLVVLLENPSAITIELIPTTWTAWDMGELAKALFNGAPAPSGYFLPLDC